MKGTFWVSYVCHIEAMLMWEACSCLETTQETFSVCKRFTKGFSHCSGHLCGCWHIVDGLSERLAVTFCRNGAEKRSLWACWRNLQWWQLVHNWWVLLKPTVVLNRTSLLGFLMDFYVHKAQKSGRCVYSLFSLNLPCHRITNATLPEDNEQIQSTLLVLSENIKIVWCVKQWLPNLHKRVHNAEWAPPQKNLSIPFYGERGLNAGVMLVSLAAVRTSNFSAERNAVIAHYGPRGLLEMGDQDVLNIIAHKHPYNFHVLPCSVNVRCAMADGVFRVSSLSRLPWKDDKKRRS